MSLISLDLNKDTVWPPDQGLRLHPRVEFSWSWPWQCWSCRWWKYGGWVHWFGLTWFLWWHHSGLSRERDSFHVRILGVGINYSWQPMTDEIAEELIDFIRDEQAADEDYGSNEYVDPLEFDSFHEDRGDID